MNDLISIIVPVYNVSDYIEKCVKSILAQTYENIEIILVDDGSKDDSGNKCEQLKQMDKRIKVIHKENGGLSSARNAGIDIAKGKYLTFIDSDDYVNVDFIKVLYNNLINYKSDISAVSVKKVYNQNQDTHEFNKSNITITEGIEKYYNIYNSKAFVTVVSWNKLYKRKIFENLRYKEGILHEDEEIIHKILSKANRIVYDDAKLYYYFQRNNSIMNKYNIKRLQIVQSLENRIDYFKEINEDILVDISKYYYLTVLTINYSFLNKTIPNYIDYKSSLKIKIKNLYREIKNSKYLSLNQKIKLKLCVYFPYLTIMIFNIKKKLRSNL